MLAMIELRLARILSLLPLLPLLTLTIACSGADNAGDGAATTAEDLQSAPGCGTVTNCKVSNVGNRRTGQHLASGSHLYDEFGTDRGEVLSPDINVNYGIRHEIQIGGTPHVMVYAWDVTMTSHAQLSGWVHEHQVNGGRGVDMPTVRNPARTLGSRVYRFRSAAATAPFEAKFGGLRVSAFGAQDRNGNLVAHYLVRGDGVLNVTQGAPGKSPGHANTTLRVDDPRAVFHRAEGSDTEMTIELFLNDGRGTPAGRSVHAIYGSVDGRFGWVLAMALDGL